MRLAYYAGASTAAAAACLLKAFHQRPNFYSATVYLSQSNACLLILTNLCLVVACSTMYALQRLLYGPLRPIEIEQLSEKAWYAVLDTLLAMPSFREDVGGWLLCMFVLLLAGKVWGWIAEGRVDVLEQGQPTPGGRASERLFHARLAASLALSVAFNLGMLNYCVETVMADPRPGMMVIFTFEFAILSVFSTFTAARYALCVAQIRVERMQMKEAIELRKSEIRAERAAARQNSTADGRPAPASPPNEEPIEVDENEVDVPGWEEKRRYLFALEVFTDFVKLMIYIVFFTVSVTFNGLPMHIMRDVYMTFASFSKRVSDYVAYRKATSDMNSRYPDATTEEIRGDACIVCRESMVAWEQPAAQQQGQAQAAQAAGQPQRRRDEGLRAKKLPCGHILHLRCLKAWLERQQVCPTCRRPVIQATETTANGAAGQGQQGAGGALLPGQAPQNGRPPRPNRARVFHFGPLRIGFLNAAPNDVLNAAQNPHPNVAADPNQQGPNHLGLAVPYPPTGQQAASVAGGAASGPRATVPAQVQMIQLEQRLLQDAHNLSIEQQQLATLRAMEAELARLRGQHMPVQQGLAPSNAVPRPAPPFPAYPPIGGWHNPQYNFHGPHLHQQQQQVLHGHPSQVMGPGHDRLPQGMTLPEGWTVMPLQRYEPPSMHPFGGQYTAQPTSLFGAHMAQPTSAFGQNPSQATSTFTGHPVQQPLFQIPTNGSAAETSGTNDATSASGAVVHSAVNGVPRNGDGSPLFVPSNPPLTNPSRTGNAQASTTPSQTAESQQPHAAAQPQPASARQNHTPWSAQGGWNFEDHNGQSAINGKDEDGPAAVTTPTVMCTDDERQPAPAPYTGKGKGRAVEVEDVPERGE